MSGFDFDKPEHYAFGIGILDGGMTFQTLNRMLKDIDLFFHKEPVYNNVYVNNEVVTLTAKEYDPSMFFLSILIKYCPLGTRQ